MAVCRFEALAAAEGTGFRCCITAVIVGVQVVKSILLGAAITAFLFLINYYY